LSVSNSGIQINSQNADSQFSMRSHESADGNYYRHWVDTNTLIWQSSSDPYPRLFVWNYGGRLSIFSHSVFNWTTYSPSLGRAEEPYWLFSQGTTLVTNNAPPAFAAKPGAAFLWNSNATVYLLTSTPNSTAWAATNKLGGP
jgi:hypothetical protein